MGDLAAGDHAVIAGLIYETNQIDCFIAHALFLSISAISCCRLSDFPLHGEFMVMRFNM